MRSSPDRRRHGPDLKAEFGVVHPDIEQATRLASAKLSELGVRHLLIGGVAVGAYARPRATKDVDFLVGPEAWPSEGLIVSPIPGLPFQVGSVPIDTLLAPHEAPSMDEALARGIDSEGIPVAPIEVIILMKLIADRPQDRADVAALLAVADLDGARSYLDGVRSYVEEHGPRYFGDLDSAVREYQERASSTKRRLLKPPP